MSDKDDLRKWNVPRCAKEIRDLQARLDGISPAAPGGECSPGNRAETFEEWVPSALLSLVAAHGWEVCSWSSVADTLQNLAAAWAVVMASRGASDAAILEHFDMAEALYKRMDKWDTQTRRNHVMSKSTGTPDVVISESFSAPPPPPGDRAAMPTTVTPQELAAEEAAYHGAD